MYYHTVSSSPQALCRTVDGAIRRVENLVIPGLEKQIREEVTLLTEIREFASSIEVSGKMKSQLSVLKKYLARLGQVKAQKKVVIFTDNRITQKRLHNLLTERGYNGILTYSGDNGRDYSIMERFRNDKNIQILISTDEAAKGLDIEFCPVVINYDLRYNAIDMEQRITRCHRQGQQSDVFVINLLGKDNFSDVRR
ncbi:MAG: SWF/SNF helicase family protein [Rikenellaceae bacterium]|nr:SWF/SNF helicase family protein [Rikenellaceae bacterium]